MKLKPQTLAKNPQKYNGKRITVTARLVPGLVENSRYKTDSKIRLLMTNIKWRCHINAFRKNDK